MEKTANQLYKESGTTLAFKEWIEREKDKGIFIKNQALANATGQNENPESQFKPSKFDLGIPKWVLISGVIIIVGAFSYKYFKK